METTRFRRSWLAAGLTLICLAVILVGAVRYSRGGDRPFVHRMVVVPEEDRFAPFAITIRVGDIVEWVNMDTDDHTIVSDDFFNTADHHGVNVLLPGTEHNGGQPGRYSLRFFIPGTFVYYCRFHAHLDHAHQPVAPGPDGGIQDDKGNFGTPMAGVITVLPFRGLAGTNSSNDQ